MGNDSARQLRKTARKSRRNQKGGIHHDVDPNPTTNSDWEKKAKATCDKEEAELIRDEGRGRTEDEKKACIERELAEAKEKAEAAKAKAAETGGKRRRSARRRRRGRKTARKSHRKGRKSARKSHRRSRR